MNYLLKGDISGIQEFIFNVQSKGAAKTLKIKSYYIEVISELCYKFCIAKLQGEGCQIESIYSGGGNFFLKITCPDGALEIVEGLQKQINNELLNDDIAIVLTLEKLNDKSFGNSWIELLRKSNKEKLKRYKKNDTFFNPYNYEDKALENNNKRFKKIAEEYQHNDFYKSILDIFVKSRAIESLFLDEVFFKNVEDLKNSLANKLPFWKDYSEKENYQVYRKENYAQDNQIKFGDNDDYLIDFDGFGDFAAHRTGTNKIAILTMDVDDLGCVFRDKASSVEMAQKLSEDFKAFFNSQLLKIWNQEEYHANIYPVFVGGDDCFIVGAWDSVLHFTKAINDAFKNRFKKEGYTLSAGIVIVNPKHPVISFSRLAKDSLSNAKTRKTYSEVFKNEPHLKNSISVFNEVFSWKEYDKILELVNQISPSIEEKGIKRSFLDKLRNSAKGFQALQNEILTTNKLPFPKIWQLKYYIGRQISDVTQEDIFSSYSEALKDALLKNEGTNPAIFPVAARLIELSTKSKLEYVSEY